MKKRHILLAGIFAVSAGLLAAGCGKKDEKTPEKPQVQVTVAPAATKAPEQDENLVSMQQSEEKDPLLTNVMGEKTATAASLVITNQTGSEISQIYIRPNTDEDEDWGEDLVKSSFKLGNGQKAVYYYEKGAKDESGNPISMYDIRIVYTDPDKTECYFRKLPMQAMTQITLRMDGTGEDGIPYATYKTSTSSSETSTLNEVKERLGLTEDDSDDSEEYQDDTSGSGDDSQNSDSGSSDDSGYEEPVEVPDEGASQAEGFIGQSLDSLTSSMGSPTGGSDYEEVPETGKTGYHYYDSFTVSTTVDENGNEVVTGIW